MVCLVLTSRVFSSIVLSVALSWGRSEEIGVSFVQLRASSLSNASSYLRPHIIFVLADDLGHNGVGYRAGEHTKQYTKVKTPFIDQLSREGVVMDAYYTGPWCAPSRFALLTGRSPWKSEAGFNNFREDTPIGTSLDYTMMPKALRDVGYETHLIGKWHQGHHMEAYLPTSRGFNAAYGIVGGCTDHFTQEVFIDCWGLIDIQLNATPYTDYMHLYKDNNKKVYGDDLYRNRAVQVIKTHNPTKPFFLYLSLQAPHEPYQVGEEYSKKYSLSKVENTYWGMHSHVDDTVKAVVDALQEKDMYKNTLLVFTSDNGATYDNAEKPFLANFPLRGHKGQLWEGGIRVPCLLHGGAIPDSGKGRKLTGLMNVEDWYATFAQLTGAALDNGGPAPHDSIGNWEYIIGEQGQSAREEMVRHYMDIHEDGTAARMSVFRQGKYKATVFGTAGDGYGRDCTPELPCVYNLENDPSETDDVASTLSDEMVNHMVSRLNGEWQQAYSQPFFGVDRPETDRGELKRACKIWKTHNMYMGPWATADDEKAFASRTFTRKMLFSTNISKVSEWNDRKLFDD